MIVIESMKWYEVEHDVAEIMCMKRGDHLMVKHSDETARIPVSAEVLHEVVHGRQFTNPQTGRSIMVGTSKEIGHLLGLQYEAWAEMEHRLRHSDSLIYGLQRTLSVQNRTLDTIREAGFLTRLVWLFSGVSTHEQR